MTYLELFFVLQILDFMTTLVGLRMGGTEMSPFISWVIRMSSPVTALTAVKLLGFAFAGICLLLGRQRVIHWVNYAFTVIVLWNMYNILRAVGGVL